MEYEVDKRGVSFRTLQGAVDEEWKALFTKGTAANNLASDHGVDLGAIPLERDRAIELVASGAGFEPSSLLIGILIKDASQIVMDIWKRVLLPRLRARFGDDAIKEKKAAARSRLTAKNDASAHESGNKPAPKKGKRSDLTPKSSE